MWAPRFFANNASVASETIVQKLCVGSMADDATDKNDN
jgi:hypothetical protein